ncbi:Protein sidekick [Gryllus bimaculatus]|nr:Protein sidekick [Gryllus bimaculatus]
MTRDRVALRRWEVDGAPLAGDEQRYAVGGLLVLPRARPAHSARYTCEASNAAGSARLELSLLVSAPLGARVQPPLLTAALGQPATFSCAAAGHPVAALHWLKDGQPVRPTGAAHVLTLPAVSKDDQGMYQCFVKNEHDMAQGTAELRLGDTPPILVYSFIRQTIQPGPSVSLKCVASGSPTPQIKWTLDGFKLPQTDRFVIGQYVPMNGDVVSHVNITNVRAEDGGTYQCTATNRVGEVTHSAQLNVYGLPYVRPMGEISAVAGTTLYITCPVAGYPIDTIKWFRVGPGGDRPLPYITRQTVFPNGTLAIQKVQSREDNGLYRCSAANKQGDRSSGTAQVNVTVPPTWVVEPKSGSAKLGEPALLDCLVEGFPQPLIVWKKASGAKLETYHPLVSQETSQPNEFGLGMHHSGMSLLPNGSLFIESVSQEDEGQYVCEASNDIGVGLSAVVYLTVRAPVHFRVRSRKEMVRRGSTAVLRCHALGDVPITFTWRKEGSFVEFQGRSSQKNISGGLESELRINAVKAEDGGIYTCFARNEYGHDQTAIHLLVQDAPEHPTNLRVLDQSSRRVTVAWTPAQDGNSPITRYPNSSAVITSLHPATTYSVHVLAENTLGPGASSQEIRVRTEDEAPSAPPQHLAADATASTQLVLSWEPPPEDQWNGQLLGHYVGHRLIGDSDNKRQYNFSTVPFRGTGKEDSRLDDLKKFCKYGLVVQAFNSRGPGPLSKEIVAQTLEDEASPRDVRCTALSPESLQVSWQPPPDALVHGVIQGYRLVYEPVSTSVHDEMIESRTKMTTALTTVLHSLLRYTNYSVELLAFTRIGDGIKSPKVFCRTKEDAPGPPSNIKAVLMMPDIALVAWLPPAHPNGVVIKYNVYVRVVENDRQVDTRYFAHTSTLHLQYQLTGLKRQLRYEFWVTAFTKVGEVSAGIISFGGIRVVSWKSDIRLPCQSVGTPEPTQQWKKDNEPLHISQQPRAHIIPDGTLLLSNVQRSDQGDYNCRVSNEHGSDQITYQLIVQVPPGAPVLLMTGSTQHSLQLQWKLGDTGGSRVQGFVLHYKHEHGEWEEFQLDGTHSTHILTGLRCGSQYHVFITAFNRVGSGDPSTTLNVRTRGAVPLRPQSSELLLVNTTFVGLNLHTWPDGGCPLLYFVVEYAPEGKEHWEVVGNNIGTDRVFSLLGLNPGRTYKLRITAHNSAGSTVAKYKFKTLSEVGGTVSPSHVVTQNDQQPPLHTDVKIVVLAVFSLIALVLSLLGICLCLKKRTCMSPSPHPSLQDVQSSATQDNKHNLARREQYYATVRKLPQSPATLECIPEYSEDIRPYATFHVPGPPNSDTTKLQTFVYRETDMSPTRKPMKSDYRRVKRSRPSEEYDSFGSESDTEPGTSSRTESSNQLDDGGIPGDGVRGYHHSASRLSKIGLESMYPGPEWSPPTEISPGAERTPFVRRYCQAHILK